MNCHANAHYMAFLGSKRKGPASLLNHLNKQVSEVLCWQHGRNTAMHCEGLICPNTLALGSRKLMQVHNRLQSASVFRAPMTSSICKNPWSKGCWCHTMNPNHIACMHRFMKPLVLTHYTFNPRHPFHPLHP